MGKKETVIVDAILGTISMNFQRAVMYVPPGNDGGRSEGPYWRDGELIDDAIKTLRKSLRILVKGFDEQIDEFVKKITEDVRYKAPEQGTQAMTMRFLAFRSIILRGKPKVSIPISFDRRRK